MSTIYWFSGTGNSYAVARDVAAGIGDARLVPVASLAPESRTAEGVVGIVCPVYFYGLPRIVRNFIRRLDLSRTEYAFAVLTSGGFPGRAPAQAAKLLRESGRAPDAVYAVTLPGNYIAMYSAPSAEASRRMASDARSLSAQIAKDVKTRSSASVARPNPAGPASALFSATLGRWFASSSATQDRRFRATSACTACGLCVRVCPAANVELTDGRPRWLGHCEQCFACIHWCPAEAIQIRRTPTAKRGRYHHPDVTAEDIASQRG
jgi:ferredoxin